MQQAYGNITIRVPDLPEGTPEELGLDTQLVNELTVTVDQWVVTIKETIDRENAKKKEGSSAQGETEYWRQRNATFNTLFQQLNLQQVKKILQVLKLKSEQSDGYNMEAFDAQYQ
jgi:dynein heavy chain